MSGPARPPGLARRLLVRLLPPEVRGSVEGDLEEVFRQRLESRGSLRARAWYWKEAMALSARFLVERWRERGSNVGEEPRASDRSRPFVADRPSWLDVKLGLRMLVKHPGLTIVGGLGMAVAIGIAAGFFTFFTSHLYPTIPLDEGDRIVALENWDTVANNETRHSLHDFVTWRQEMETVEEIGAFRTIVRNLIPEDGDPRPIRIAEMTASGFDLARVPPLLGRHLVAADQEPGAPPVIVIGHDVWQGRFGGDPDVVGRRIRIGDTLHEIVGVMPEGFGFPEVDRYWVPFRHDPAEHARGEGPWIHVFGRLAPGATMQEARAEIATIGHQASADYPDTHAHLRPRVWPYTHSLTDIQGINLWEIGFVQLMVSLLLVVVAVNVAVLSYARTAMRRGELAVRTALGASRQRLVTQLFVEALVLSAGAAAVGLALARVGLNQANSMMELEFGGVPFWMDSGLSPGTALYVGGLAVLGAVIVGVVPGLQATGRGLEASLSHLGGSTGMRLGRTWTLLIVAQVAIAVFGIPAAASIGWQMVPGATTEATFPRDRLLVGGLILDGEVTGGADPAQEEAAGRGARLHDEFVRRLEDEPRIAAVTHAARLPGSEQRVRVQVEAESDSGDGGEAIVREGRVRPGFLATFEASLLAGRLLESGDVGRRPYPAVVSRSFVERVLDGEDPLGRRLRRLPGEASAAPAVPEEEARYEIVGVVEDLFRNRLAPELVEPTLIRAAPAGETPLVVMRVREASVEPDTLRQTMDELRRSATELDPGLRLSVRSMAESREQAEMAVRLAALVLVAIVASVLLLSGAGIYALMSFAVTRRRREIGIRTALGGQAGNILASVFGRSCRQLAIGVVVGVGIAATLDGLVGGELLVGSGPMLLAGTSLLMLVVGLLATLGPARRGLRIDPTQALREE